MKKHIEGGADKKKQNERWFVPFKLRFPGKLPNQRARKEIDVKNGASEFHIVLLWCEMKGRGPQGCRKRETSKKED